MDNQLPRYLCKLPLLFSTNKKTGLLRQNIVIYRFSPEDLGTFIIIIIIIIIYTLKYMHVITVRRIDLPCHDVV